MPPTDRALIEPKEGPRCSECPLYDKGIPIHDLMPMGDAWCGLTVVGEMPGRSEVPAGVPFVGPSGKLLWAVCDHVNVPREELHVTNCVRCGLRGGAKLPDATMREAIDCCRALLMHNLQELQPSVVLAVGAVPWESLSGLKGIDKWRGTVQRATEAEPWHLMATLHPAGLLRVESRRILVELMFADVRHAYALATGQEEIWEPDVVDTSDWAQVVEFVRASEGRPLALDVETDGIDALTCNLLTVGVAWQDEGGRGSALSFPWPDAFPLYWSAEQSTILTNWLQKLLSSSRQVVVFQNKGYDIPVLRRHVGDVCATCEDTLLLHHATYPKLPHTLEQITSQFLLTEAWKSDYRASEVEKAWEEAEGWDDEEESEKVREGLADRALGELLWYNAADAAATIALYYILRREAAEANVLDVYERDRELMDCAIDWHEDGIGIDLEKSGELADTYRSDLDAGEVELRRMCGFPDQGVLDAQLAGVNLALNWWLAEIKVRRSALKLALKFVAANFADDATEAEEAMAQAEKVIKDIRTIRKAAKKATSWQTFNPNSPIQLRETLMRRGLTPTKVTEKTLEASTSKASLWDLRGDEFVEVLFRWRTKHKLWSTYLRPMPNKIHADGRIHPVWKLHSTPSGRFGTQPAVQNWPDEMKALMIASKGCKLVGADYAALELRVVALLSGEPEWVDTFQRNGDLHAAMSYYYFPTEFARLDAEWQDVEGDEAAKDAAVPGRKALRKAGKPVTFGDIYLGGAVTLYEQIREERPEVKTRAEQARLLREVTAMQKRLRAATPTRLEWANVIHAEAEREFCLTTARWRDVCDDESGAMEGGRLRKWPLGEASPNETTNHPVQGMAADIMNSATRRLAGWLKDLGLYRNGIWIVLQVHDALYLEVEDRTIGSLLPISGYHEGIYGGPIDDDMPLPEFAARLLERAMFTKVEYTSPVTMVTNWMEFPAEAKIGSSVKEV